MEILIADSCGLCGGCKAAINTTIERLNKGEKVTIFKEIVHNKNVNNFLLAYGAKTASNIEELPQDNTIIIRAHGEPPATYKYFKAKGIQYCDCTCPNVIAIHNAVEKYSSAGYEIVLLGKHKEKLHPEVEGTIGYAKTKVSLVQDKSDLEILKQSKLSKVYIVCQTTFNMELADKLIKEIEAIASAKGAEIVVNKSICSAQKQINISSVKMSRNVDFVIVVGGKNSSNSKELFENIKNICPAIFIEDIYEWKRELDKAGIKLSQNSKIGLTAGASTMKEELLALQKLIAKAKIQ